MTGSPPNYGEMAEMPGPPPSYTEMTKAPTHGEMTESGMDPTAAAVAANGKIDLEPVTKCRERSKSIWIHFPHVELVFLLYAVQGSLATQLGVLRHGNGAIVFVAAIALVRTNRAFVAFPSAIMLTCKLHYPRRRTSGSCRTCTLTRVKENERDRSGSKA